MFQISTLQKIQNVQTLLTCAIIMVYKQLLIILRIRKYYELQNCEG